MAKITLHELERAKEGLREPTIRSASNALSLILEELNVSVGDTTAYHFHNGKGDVALKSISKWLSSESEKLNRMRKLHLPCIEEMIERQECRVEILGRLVTFLGK